MGEEARSHERSSCAESGDGRKGVVTEAGGDGLIIIDGEYRSRRNPSCCCWFCC